MIAAAQAAFEPRISPDGRRAKSARAAAFSAPSTAPPAMTSLRVRGLRSFHFLFAIAPLCPASGVNNKHARPGQGEEGVDRGTAQGLSGFRGLRGLCGLRGRVWSGSGSRR